uniref:Uncharacterized protein n=1 Tax=Anguilla anguilla TaxID=7936 RepID=A0A0E9TG75_ANGAN
MHYCFNFYSIIKHSVKQVLLLQFALLRSPYYTCTFTRLLAHSSGIRHTPFCCQPQKMKRNQMALH